MKKVFRLIFLGVIIGITVKVLNKKQISIHDLAKTLSEQVASAVEEFIREVGQPDPGEQEDDRQVHASLQDTEPLATQPFSNDVPERDAGNGLEFNGSRIRNKIDLTGSGVYGREYLIPRDTKKDKGRWRELDKWAREIPPQYEQSIEQLIGKLMKPAKNELEKARLIYSWIATHIHYDDRGFNTGFYCDTEAGSVLKYKVAVCQGYSNLFTALGLAAGLEVVSVTGYSKGISYTPGSRFHDTNHAWNAFKAEGIWRLADLTWGAGHGKAVNGRLVSEMEFNDFWFDTDPDRFIFTHLPQSTQYQFSSQQVSFAEYQRMLKISEAYFALGFDGTACLAKVKNGQALELPFVYHIDGAIQALSLQQERIVPANQPIRLKVRSEEAVEMAVINNGEWIYMQQSGEEFLAVIDPRPGDLSLQVKFDPGENFFNTVLKYEVR
ncbi:MAG: hypothetical protein K9J30_08950 [Bacteroidales bacterium]|nr:hypothetical protein [Bacteroidales bacterium]